MARYLLTLLLALLLAPTTAGAVDIPPLPAELGGVDALIDRARDAVKEDTGMPAETRDEALAALADARQSLGRLRAHQEGSRAFREAGERAPAELVGLEKERAAVLDASTGPRVLDPDLPLEALEQRLARVRAERGAAEARLTELQAQQQVEASRPEAARQRIVRLEQLQEEVGAALSAPFPPPEDVAGRARRFAQELRGRAIAAELQMLEQELLTHSARQQVLQERRELAEATLARLQKQVEFLREEVNTRRRSAAEEAEKAAAEAQREVAGKHPVVQGLAESNARLTRELAQLTSELEGIGAATDQAVVRTREIQESHKRAQQRLELAGFSDALGRVLLEERRGLPRSEDFHDILQERRREVSQLGLSQEQLKEERRSLADLEAAVTRRLARAAPQPPDPARRAQLREELHLLLAQRRELLEQADSTYRNYLNAIGDLDFAQRQLLKVARDYAELLDQHLLWTPNAKPVGSHSLHNLVTASLWFIQPEHWLSLADALATGAARQLPLAVAGVLVLGFLLWVQRPLGRRLAKLTEGTRRLSTDHIGLTLRALAAVPVQAAPVPLSLYLLGFLVVEGASGTTFAENAGGGLIVVAQLVLNVYMLGHFCAPEGVAERHFHWPVETMGLLRRGLIRLARLTPVPVFITVVALRSGDPVIADSLGRLMFLVTLGLLTHFFYVTFHPAKGVAAGYIQHNPRSLVARTRLLWFPAAVGAPVFFAGLTLFGFSYTSVQLTRQFVDTLWLLTGVIILNDLGVRALALTQRKIALRWALEKREAARQARAEAEDEDQGQATHESDIPAVEEEEIDLAVVDHQSRRLLHTALFVGGVLGLFLIWFSVIPALGILDSVTLWEQSSGSGEALSLQPITLGDLAVALLVVALTVVAGRNIPGVLELGLLQRLEITPGSRYATVTLTRYAIVAAGIIAGFSVMGVNWSQVQWLVAALGVGLGFGLQEIFGNFASGLFILFERPVRVGDTVTVGDLTGTVTRIRFRATTITDWDRKEIIVPNKAFITERVINWTLSDPITRMVIPVSIAYGSDTAKAHQVISETLEALPLVMDNPPPKAYFSAFGESSLDFKLYIYVRQLEDLLPLRHEVHMALERSLREAGITIPFPQRDVHLRREPPTGEGHGGGGRRPV